jgi:hypothetical protein
MPVLPQKRHTLRAAFPKEALAHAVASGAIAPVGGSVLPFHDA